MVSLPRKHPILFEISMDEVHEPDWAPHKRSCTGTARAQLVANAVEIAIFAARLADAMRDRIAKFSAAAPKRRPRETGKTVRFAARLAEVRVIHRAPPAVAAAAFYGRGDFARFSRDEIARRRLLGIASRTCITSSAIAWAEPEPGSPRPRLARSDATVRSLPSPLARSPSLRGGQVWPAGWEDASEERLE